MQGTFTVTVADLLRVLSNAAVFASGDQTLPVLAAVRVELSAPDGSNSESTLTAVATDRYTIGMDTCSAIGVTVAVNLLLPVADVQRLCKSLKASGKPRYGGELFVVAWVEDDGRVRFDLPDDSSITVRQQDGEFPKFRSLIPDETALQAADGVHEIRFNPALLARFDKVASGHRTDVMVLRFITPLKPALVRKGDTFTGLIMPVRAPAAS